MTIKSISLLLIVSLIAITSYAFGSEKPFTALNDNALLLSNKYFYRIRCGKIQGSFDFEAFVVEGGSITAFSRSIKRQEPPKFPIETYVFRVPQRAIIKFTYVWTVMSLEAYSPSDGLIQANDVLQEWLELNDPEPHQLHQDGSVYVLRQITKK